MSFDHGLLNKWKLTRAASTDSRITRGDLAVLMQILDQMNDGEAWPGLSYIARAVRIDRSNVVRGVKRLVDSGYLVRESGNHRRSNRYRMGAPTRCSTATRRAGASSGTHAPSAGAGAHHGVGVATHLEPAYQNPPKKPDSASPLPSVWSDGVKLLTDPGTQEPDARAAIGKARKELGEDGAVDLVMHMLAVRPTAPRSYLYGAIQRRLSTKRADKWRLPRDRPSDDDLVAANERALAQLGLHP